MVPVMTKVYMNETHIVSHIDIWSFSCPHESLQCSESLQESDMGRDSGQEG